MHTPTRAVRVARNGEAIFAGEMTAEGTVTTACYDVWGQCLSTCLSVTRIHLNLDPRTLVRRPPRYHRSSTPTPTRMREDACATADAGVCIRPLQCLSAVHFGFGRRDRQGVVERRWLALP